MPTLHQALTGRLLTGIWLEADHFYLRLSDCKITDINLVDRHLTTGERPDGGNKAPWITFPGWLKILRVLQDSTQIILEVGALYTARICVRRSKERWRIVFQGGRALAA